MKIKDIFKSKAEREEDRKATERLQRTVARMTGQIPLYNEPEMVKKPQEVKEVGQSSNVKRIMWQADPDYRAYQEELAEYKNKAETRALQLSLANTSIKMLKDVLKENGMGDKIPANLQEAGDLGNTKHSDNTPNTKPNRQNNDGKITKQEHDSIIHTLTEKHKQELEQLRNNYERRVGHISLDSSNVMDNFKFNKTEAAEVKRTYKLRPSTIAALEEVKKKLYPNNIEITLNELADEAIQVYCQIKHKR